MFPLFVFLTKVFALSIAVLYFFFFQRFAVEAITWLKLNIKTCRKLDVNFFQNKWSYSRRSKPIIYIKLSV